jgi:hypothetical protein
MVIIVNIIHTKTRERILQVSEAKKIIKDGLEVTSVQYKKYQKKYKKKNPKGSVKGIIIFPEYLFCSYNKSYNKEPLNQKEYSKIIKFLKNLSGKYKGFIIIAGTTFHKQLFQNETMQVKLNTAMTQKQYFLKYILDQVNPDMIKPKKTSGKQLFWDYQINKSKKQLEQRIKTQSTQITNLFKKNIPVKVVRNTCGLLYNGIYQENDKVVGFEERKNIDVQKDGVFLCFQKGITGGNSGLGIKNEICFEHNVGVLKSNSGEPPLFHTVVSDYVETEINNISVHQDGYFIHSSTEKSECKVIKGDKLNNTIPPRDVIYNNKLKISNMLYYVGTQSVKPITKTSKMKKKIKNKKKVTYSPISKKKLNPKIYKKII